MKTFAAIDLSQLPAPSVVEPLDYEQIFIERKAYAVSLWPADQQAEVAATLELESEPLTKLLQENAYRETIWRQRVNEAALANMLASAQGADLDRARSELQRQAPGYPARRSVELAARAGTTGVRRQPARAGADGMGRPQHRRAA